MRTSVRLQLATIDDYNYHGEWQFHRDATHMVIITVARPIWCSVARSRTTFGRRRRHRVDKTNTWRSLGDSERINLVQILFSSFRNFHVVVAINWSPYLTNVRVAHLCSGRSYCCCCCTFLPLRSRWPKMVVGNFQWNHFFIRKIIHIESLPLGGHCHRLCACLCLRFSMISFGCAMCVQCTYYEIPFFLFQRSQWISGAHTRAVRKSYNYGISVCRSVHERTNFTFTLFAFNA